MGEYDFFHEHWGLDAVYQFLIILRSVSETLLKKMHRMSVIHVKIVLKIDIEIKCLEHDHLTGAVKGMAHQICNINYRSLFTTVVIIIAISY